MFNNNKRRLLESMKRIIITLISFFFMTIGKGSISMLKFIQRILTLYVMLIIIPFTIFTTEIINTQTRFRIKKISLEQTRLTLPRIIKRTIFTTFMVTYSWKITQSLLFEFGLIYSTFLTLTIFITNSIFQTRTGWTLLSTQT